MLLSLLSPLLSPLLCRRVALLLPRAAAPRAHEVEPLALRHESRVLRRQLKRTRWRPTDRLLLAVLSRCLLRAEWARFPVRPETLLRRHRALVRRRGAAFGRSRGPGRPPLPPELQELLLRLARENPRWGHQRLRGERLQRGHSVAATTIQSVLRRPHIPPAPQRAGPSWPAFLRAHATGLLACDFFTVETVRRQTLSVLFFLEVPTRRGVVAGCAPQPRAAWVTQQARNVTRELAEEGFPPTVLLRDRDATFVPDVDAGFAAQDVRVGRTPVRTPPANAFAERWVGTVRRDCLDWLLIVDARHLQRVLRGYADHDNRARPHRGRGLPPPLGPSPPPPSNSGPVCRRDRLGGLLHEYERVAA